MSPTPTRSPKATTDQTAAEFERVRARLPDARSAYERAWLSLGRSLVSEYPSSAAFVRNRWEGQLHLLLCEVDRATADEIWRWLSGLDGRTTSVELHRGDWRERFLRGIPATFDAYFVSFDPNMYDRHNVRAPKPANMYPRDIAIVVAGIRGLPRVPLVLQVSTYSVNGANSQTDVLDDLVPQFANHGFTLAASVRADNAMMSMIFTRDMSVGSDLEPRFQSWLAGQTCDSVNGRVDR